MRISDWSSDVCSSDLRSFRNAPNLQPVSALQTVTAGVNTRSFALFGQLDNHLTDEVTLSIGGRYTDEKRKLVDARVRSEEHTSELQSLMRTSYAAFCLKNRNNVRKIKNNNQQKHYTHEH